MLRSAHRRTAAFSVALASACLLITPTAASARLIEHTRDRGTESFAQEVCGLDVITTVTFVDNSLGRTSRSGFPLFQSTGRATVTFANPDTGLSVTKTNAGVNFKDLSATDNGDGTVTVRTAIVGMPEQITLADGTVAVKDVGRIVFADVLDFNGTPANPEDDIFISETVQSVSGPHPEAASGFTLFCSIVVDGLT